MTEIFVDTGAWLAVADPKDKFHSAAANIYPTLLSQYSQLITSNLVCAELYSLALYRIGYYAAISLLTNIQNSSKIYQVYTSPQVNLAAISILQKYDDQDFSLIDATSFAIMQDRKISEVFAYDHHFSVMGFQLKNR